MQQKWAIYWSFNMLCLNVVPSWLSHRQLWVRVWDLRCRWWHSASQPPTSSWPHSRRSTGSARLWFSPQRPQHRPRLTFGVSRPARILTSVPALRCWAWWLFAPTCCTVLGCRPRFAAPLPTRSAGPIVNNSQFKYLSPYIQISLIQFLVSLGTHN